MNEAPGPSLFTLADVVRQLRGAIGKTNLVRHLKAVPRFAGGPTHRKNGAKYLFTPEDVARIIESLAVASDGLSPGNSLQERAAPSETQAYERAMKRLAQGAAKSERRSHPAARRGIKQPQGD